MKRYVYEVHFPNSKERFESDLDIDDFLDLFNKPGGVENSSGDVIVMPRVGNVIGRMICYIKRTDNNTQF